MSKACRHLSFLSLVLSVAISTCVSTAAIADEETTSEGKTISVNGMDMYYEVHGDGETLVLLHGFSRSGAIWKPFITEFSKHFQLIIPDLRGHGRSTNPSKSFTLRQSAQDVLALLDALHISRFRAIGISAGGMTLLHMATTQPERVESMVLVGATSYFPNQARAIMAAVDFDKFTDEELAFYRRLHKHGDEQIRLLAEQFVQFSDNYDDMNFTSPYLSTVTAKTLILHGDRDEFFPVSIAVELYQSIPSSYLWIVPNGGHVPFDEDWKPDDTNRLLQFLKGEWEGKNSPR